jgi:hypothetical protein
VRIPDSIQRGLAAIADKVAAVGERIPGVAQITIAAGPVAVTVQPTPPQSALVANTCPTCGR